METSSPPHPAIDLSTQMYCQLVYTLTNLLPPLDDTPEALRARNHAAIAKVAALLPVNANEADLVAQCITARPQTEEILRLLRQYADDNGFVMRLNGQYGSMTRTSLSVFGHHTQMQALRRKREAIDGAASGDAWAEHVAERSTLGVEDPDSGPLETAWPKGTLDVPRVESPAACADHRVGDDISENGTNSQDAAFETCLSEQPWNAKGPGETALRNVVNEAMAKSRLANLRLGGQELPANSRESLRNGGRRLPSR